MASALRITLWVMPVTASSSFFASSVLPARSTESASRTLAVPVACVVLAAVYSCSIGASSAYRVLPVRERSTAVRIGPRRAWSGSRSRISWRSGSTKTVLQNFFRVSSCSGVCSTKPWNLNGVSVHGRSSSATYMPNCSSATGTVFLTAIPPWVLRLPHAARHASGTSRAPGRERARRAARALRLHLPPDRHRGRGDLGCELALQRDSLARAADRAGRLLAGGDGFAGRGPVGSRRDLSPCR